MKNETDTVNVLLWCADHSFVVGNEKLWNIPTVWSQSKRPGDYETSVSEGMQESNLDSLHFGRRLSAGRSL
jgi:hypothetical protein